MANALSENEWNRLLKRIDKGNCTPFLGAGACYGTLPLGAEIAREWAKKFGYPFEDSNDLVRVAQFMVTQTDALSPKEEILERFQGVDPPNFKEVDEPHGVLAGLPLPVYMTTNYDDFMVQALKYRRKAPNREMCRWNHLVRNQPSVFDDEPDYQPHPANPVVFHLHGHSVPESLVLTEDDYLRFLATMARDPALIPQPIQAALAKSALLFIGYRLADWNFRVLLQGLRPTTETMSLVVMVPPGGSEETRAVAQKYLESYYQALGLRVYWGTAREFCGELRRRWKEFTKDD